MKYKGVSIYPRGKESRASLSYDGTGIEAIFISFVMRGQRGKYGVTVEFLGMGKSGVFAFNVLGEGGDCCAIYCIIGIQVDVWDS